MNSNVEKLAEILRVNGKEQQALEIAGLMDYVNNLEKQLSVLVAELNKVKVQLGDTHTPLVQPQAQASAMRNHGNKILDNVETMQLQIMSVKEKIIQTAKSIVTDFKDKGIAALDRMVEFSGIKQALTDINANIKTNIQEVDKAINKVNAVSQEFNATVKHTKNVFRIISNKERINDEAHPSQNLVKPLNAVKQALAKADSASKGAIDKLDQLATKAVERKPSVIQALQQHKEHNKATDKVAQTPKIEVVR